jgi:hypothetical protein
MNSALLLGDMAARAAVKTAQEYHDTTTLHPIGAVSILVLGCWFLCSARSRAMLPLMILICFIPSAQRIVIAGADFTFLRIMVLIGLSRILMRREWTTIKLNRIDIVYFLWVIVGAIVYVVQQQQLSAIVYACGTSLDMLGAYLVVRAIFRSIDDLWSFARILAGLAIVVSVFIAVEAISGRNIFGTFGGVPQITAIRDGRLRCQGAFSHPILAGVFWAAVGAFLLGGAFGAERRKLFIIGSISCLVIVAASASSTPLLGFAAAVGIWGWWPFRRWTRYVFAAAPLVAVALHLVMTKPVWHLVTRVSAVGGSTGYHRYVLIDGAISHFHEWWLVGSKWTGHWSEHYQTWDLTNQYVFEGVRGGVWRLALFMLLVGLVALAIGRAQRRADRLSDQLLLWGLGAALFVHCVCFIGVSYFGQISYLWYITLAIGSAAGTATFSSDLDHRETYYELLDDESIDEDLSDPSTIPLFHS